LSQMDAVESVAVHLRKGIDVRLAAPSGMGQNVENAPRPTAFSSRCSWL
jgi:hypothetical protein